jgi:hypothetical protein
MTELNQEWRELRKQIGNFFCKLENEGNRAVGNAEIRQKIYDSAKDDGYKLGYMDGTKELWDCVGKYLDMPAHEQRNRFGSMSLKDIIARMTVFDFKLAVNSYYAQQQKAEEEKSLLPEIGDVVKGKDNSVFADESGIVIAVSENKVKYVTKTFSRCEIGIDTYKNYFEKTGEHYDMTNSYFLKEDKK